MLTDSIPFRFIRTDAGAGIVKVLLALTMLVAPIAFIEPSPYEGMVLLLGVAAFAFGLPVERRILPLFLLLTTWAVSGFFAVLPVFADGRALVYYEISVYMMITTVLFACLLAEDTAGRVATLSSAYAVAATGVSLIAVAAYFGMIPKAETFMVNGRAAGSFKDPNVFAPYLILPLLVLIQRTVYRGVRPLYIAGILVILFALFLSFSRGAWGHFVFSTALMVGLLLFTETSARLRRRLIVGTVAASLGIAVLVAVALSFSQVREMFTIRAELLQDYDSSARSGRFGRQKEAIDVVIDNPNGLGPMQFGKKYRGDVHNVYLSAFVAYGWAGGIAYLAIVIVTLKRGFRALKVPSPWRGFQVAAYATFVGVAVEGLIIDTDHWRHFFLLVGVIWGLAVATGKLPMSATGVTRSGRSPRPAAPRPAPPIEWSRPAPAIERARRR